MNNYQLGGTGSELDTTLQYILEKIENMKACNNSAASVPVDLSEYLKLSIISGMFAPCDLEGNEITWDEVQTEKFAFIKAKKGFFSIKNVSAFGFSDSEGSGSGGSVDIEQILSSGTRIATINGVNIFAPKGGASSWDELTGTPPGVSTFPNNAGYLTSAALSGYATTEYVAQTYVSLNTFNSYKSVVSKDISDSAQGVKDWVTGKRYGKSLGINGKYLCLLDENGNKLNEVIAPYAAYTEQLGATNSTAEVSIYGEVTMKNGSLAVAGNVNANFNLSAGGNLSAGKSLTVTGESRFNGAVYLPGQFTFFGQNKGIYIEADFADGKAAYIGVHQSFNGNGTIATINSDYSVRIWQSMAINQDPKAGTSLRVGGVLETDFLTAGSGMTRPDGYWLASPNGFFGDLSSGLYTTFGGGGIELYHDTPYIDFHHNSSTDYDFTSRLIASENGVLEIQSPAPTDPALRIGGAYLRYDKVNNALYVTGQNGAQVHLYATGGIAAYSGLGSGITQLANLSLTGQLTAASVKANYVESDGDLRLNSGSDSRIILNKNTTVDSDGWITTPQLNATQRIVVNSGGDIRIGSIAAEYRITDVHADGTYVYITINGKRYRFTPSSTTAV